MRQRQASPRQPPPLRAPAEAPPPPIEARRPRRLTGVRLGRTNHKSSCSALGQPVKKAKVGTKDIYYYKDFESYLRQRKSDGRTVARLGQLEEPTEEISMKMYGVRTLFSPDA